MFYFVPSSVIPRYITPEESTVVADDDFVHILRLYIYLKNKSIFRHEVLNPCHQSPLSSLLCVENP